MRQPVFDDCSAGTIRRVQREEAGGITMQYVMSDIHGNLENFESVLAQISLRPDDTLYILGDVIDRHPAGIRILRRIMEMPNVKMLLGNHEWMMLTGDSAPYASVR